MAPHVAVPTGICIAAVVAVVAFWFIVPWLGNVFSDSIITNMSWPDAGGWLLMGIAGAYVVDTAAWWSANRLLSETLNRWSAFFALKVLRVSGAILTCAA